MKYKHSNIFKLHFSTIISLNIIVTIIHTGSINIIANANPSTSNSLEKPLVDPLIPSGNIQRNLSLSEKSRINQEIIKIDRQANRELNLGNQELAFQLWFRELRLQRALGIEAEVAALGRIGNIAWQQNRSLELREIAQRLINIEQNLDSLSDFNSEFLISLGSAYKKIKYIDRAVNIYKIVLNLSRRKNNLTAEKNNLEQLGNLYLAKFDYLNAALVYEELLSLVDNNFKNQENSQLVEVYLVNLVEIYHRLKQPKAAIKNQKKLISKYITEGKITSVATLKIAVGKNYQNLKEIKLASQYYQDAYTLAQSLKQVALAADALNQLAVLYQEENQWESAIAIYQQLIEIEQKNNNFYGLINSYDKLGNIFLEVEEYSQALESFKAALELANSLNYKTEYFIDKVRQFQ